jgi:hypothetical protein
MLKEVVVFAHPVGNVGLQHEQEKAEGPDSGEDSAQHFSENVSHI